MTVTFEHNPEYRIIPENEITAKLDEAIRHTLVACYPHTADHFSRQRWYHSPHQRTVAALGLDGIYVGGLVVVDRTITIGDKSFTMAGIGNVCTLPDYRGRGIIDRVMALSLDDAKTRGVDVGVLFCVPALEKVYGRMGWSRLDAPVSIDDGSGNAVPPKSTDIVMGIAIGCDRFPEGPVNLNGRDW